uniref:Leucyl aminopeptidase n=1 Tax=Clostridioides difficile TaxID=1496 RepID=A0A381I8U2_CLODI|nr:leucyl aminopeptidase [Clostridioides difficile]
MKINNLVNVCLVGFGKRELLNREKIRIIGGNLCKKLKNILKNEAYKSSDVNVLNLNLNSDEIGCFVEGILLGNYKF